MSRTSFYPVSDTVGIQSSNLAADALHTATEPVYVDNWSFKLEGQRYSKHWEDFVAEEPPKAIHRKQCHNQLPVGSSGHEKKRSSRRRVAEDSDDEHKSRAKPQSTKSKLIRPPNSHNQNDRRSQRNAWSAIQDQRSQISQAPVALVRGQQEPQKSPAQGASKVGPAKTSKSKKNYRNPVVGSWEFAHLGQLAAKPPRHKLKPQQQHMCRWPFKQQSFFLGKLPGELRNRIYEFVIPKLRVLIIATRPNKERVELQSAWENQDKYIKLPRSQLYCQIINHQIDAGFQMSAGLLLTCKALYPEVLSFMYSRTTFCFDSLKVIDRFLKVAPGVGIGAIRSILLRNEGYGEPKYTKHIIWKEKHDLKWHETCERINREMPMLESIRLEVRVQDWPVHLTTKEPWCEPLLSLVKDRPLRSVQVRLNHYMFHRPRLEAMERRIEDRMMSEEGKTIRDKEETLLVLREVEEKRMAERARRVLLPRQQATKVLCIKVPEDHKAAAAKPKQTTKEYTTSVANWRWKYGDGNILGPDPNCYQLY